LIKIAVKSMGLDELYPFKPEEKIIEYAIRHKTGSEPRLVDRKVEDFVWETASESPAPGGGSIAACAGAFGAALGAMVANLSSHRRGWDERWEEFSEWAVRGKACHDRLLRLVDEDTEAFNRIMDAWRLPAGGGEEEVAKAKAIEDATKEAIEVPFHVMETALESMQVIRAMAETGMETSVSDAGVGALCARTAVMGAYLNVKINCPGLEDRAWAEDILARGAAIQEKAMAEEREILKIVETKLAETD
jgi:glutamate formiminotransferase/formiminotetrahydrofolate cyclodeaminase